MYARQLATGDDLAVGKRDLRAGGQVEAGLDGAVVAQGDSEAGVGAQQATLPDRDDLGAAARQRAHDRCATAHITVGADHHPGRDAPLDHRGAEGTGIEVAEALVHDRGADRQVGAEPHAIGVGDTDAVGHDVVEHARELVDPFHRDHMAIRGQGGPQCVDPRRQNRPGGGPGHVGEHTEHAVDVDSVRSDLAPRQHVEP